MTNTDQIAAWAGPVGQTWVKLNGQLDRQLEPIGAKVTDAAALREGEAVLDVGCGGGATSLELARRVGPTGRVLGVDVSTPLLDLARTRAAGASNIDFVEGDAQTQAFGAGGFDCVYSRFGVMFFDDPTAAFANLRRAAKPGGRLAFACWRHPEENRWLNLPLEAARTMFPDRPPIDLEAPGPFAFSSDRRVRDILKGSGWSGHRIEAFDLEVGGSNLDDSVQMLIRVGPLGAALRDAGGGPS